jgi:hypothetical protein
MQAAPSSRPALTTTAWLLLGLSAFVCVVWFVHALGYWEDDAYIHLEFARSVAAGRGFSFNGHIVYGDTSPLWVALLVAFHALIPDWMAAGKTLTAAAAVFSLSGIFVFSRSLVRNTLGPEAADNFAATMVLITVVNPYFGYWAFSGMEALTASGLVCWACAAIAPTAARISTKRFLTAAFLAGLAPILRPEMSFFSILLGLVLIARWYRTQHRISVLIAGFVLITAPALLWAQYAVRTFGMVVPNTNAAKRAGPHDIVAERLLQVYLLGFPVVLLGLALLGGWLLWYLLRGRGRSAGIAPLLPIGGWLLFVWSAINCLFYIADHTYVQTRYIDVTAPVLSVAILAIAAQRSTALYRGLLAFTLVAGVTFSAFSTWPLVRNKVEVDRIYAQLADFIRTLPPDAPVAHYSIGEAAFLSNHPLVDTGGITRPGILPYMYDTTETRRTAWVYSQGAKYEVVDLPPVPGAVLVWSHDMPSTSWTMHLHPNDGLDHLHVWKLPEQK